MYIILELPPPSSNHAPKGFQKKKSYQLSSWVFDLRSIFRNMSMAATGRPTVFHWSGKVPWSQQLRSWTRTRVLSFKKVKDSNWFHIFVFCDNIYMNNYFQNLYIYIIYIYIILMFAFPFFPRFLPVIHGNHDISRPRHPLHMSLSSHLNWFPSPSLAPASPGSSVGARSWGYPCHLQLIWVEISSSWKSKGPSPPHANPVPETLPY